MPVNFDPYLDEHDTLHPPEELAFVLRLFWPHCIEGLHVPHVEEEDGGGEREKGGGDFSISYLCLMFFI